MQIVVSVSAGKANVCDVLQKTGVKRGSGAKLALSGRALASPILITLNREFGDGFALEACF